MDYLPTIFRTFETYGTLCAGGFYKSRKENGEKVGAARRKPSVLSTRIYWLTRC